MRHGFLFVSLSHIKSPDDAIEYLSDHGRVSRALDVSIPVPLVRDVALITLDDEHICAICMVHIGSKIGMHQRRAQFDQPIILYEPISLELIRRAIGGRSARYLSINSGETRRLSPKLSEELHQYFEGRPELGVDIKELVNLRRHRDAGRGVSLDPLQANAIDANLLSAELFNGKRARESMLATQSKAGASFLESIFSTTGPFVKPLEDKIIDYDATIFPGFELVMKNPAGMCLLENGNGRLITINANKTATESCTGVDMIYYNTIFDSFVMVQYKCMHDESDGQPCYRPGGNKKSYEREMASMDRINASLNGVCEDLGDFRLSACPFYFKLCESKSPGPMGYELSKGMYIPLELFKAFMEDPITTGPQGGKYIGWSNCYRKFNNSEFAGLVRSGWIGTPKSDSRTIEDVIAESLNLERHVVVSYEYRRDVTDSNFFRDSFGRFTDRGDPSGNWDSDIPF